MKITKLQIDGYKNLDIKMEHLSDSIAIIGNNGSGKSNLLEALSLIFKSLYKKGENVSFDYLIEYKNSNNETIKIEKKKSQINYYKDDETLISYEEYLPKKLIAIYSGEEDRLWLKCYEPIYKEFVDSINKAQIEKTGYILSPKMLYINKFYWHIALLSIALSDSAENEKFLEQTLGIKSIDKIKFDFDKRSYQNYSNSPTLDFISKFDNKAEYKLSELKNIFKKSGYIPDDVFNHLYLAFTPKNKKILKDIIIKFNKNLTIEDLSEGEKKLLLVKAALEFAEQEDSMFLLDEPDAHVHIANKEKIVDLINNYKTNRQIIITTHSPTMTQAINEDELYMLDNGGFVDRKKQEIINDLTGEFWNKQQQNTFLVSNKEIILLVEGKNDKVHIENAFKKLKNDFQELDFDIYSLGGESKIRPFMVGLYEAGFNNKIHIAIYDNDGAGVRAYDKFGKKVDNLNCKYLTGNNKELSNFFAFTITKPENFTEDCTIENMYSSNKYEDAYKKAVNQAIGHFANQSIEKINESIKNNSKNILAENSKSFEKDDFVYFKPIFELILKIKDKSKTINKSEKRKPLASKLPKQEIFYLKRKNIDARGIYDENDGSFTVLSGSTIRKTFTKSTKDKYREQRGELLKTKKYEEINGSYIIKEDIKFKSPSGAAKFVNGGTLNGWQEWKNNKGRSLDNIYRK